MKRNVIYRGKSIETNEWVYGSLVQWYDSNNSFIHTYNSVLVEPETNTYDFVEKRIEVKPDSVGQQTMFYDKTNKLIYEGDIVKDGLGLIMFDDVKGMFMVRWHDNFFKVVRTSKGEPLFQNSHIAWEIIGNITDNPEIISNVREERKNKYLNRINTKND